MDLAIAKKAISPIERNAQVQVSHLLFADMLIFCHADKQSMQHVSYLLGELELNTDLAINKQKSRIYFSKGCVDKNSLMAIIGFPGGRPPIKTWGYLCQQTT